MTCSRGRGGITVKLTPGFLPILRARSAGQEPLSLSCSLSAKLLLEKCISHQDEEEAQVWKVPSLKSRNSRSQG